MLITNLIIGASLGTFISKVECYKTGIEQAGFDPRIISCIQPFVHSFLQLTRLKGVCMCCNKAWVLNKTVQCIQYIYSMLCKFHSNLEQPVVLVLKYLSSKQILYKYKSMNIITIYWNVIRIKGTVSILTILI